MNVGGTELGQNGVRILYAFRGVWPVTNIDGRVEYQVGGAALETGLSVLTFVILPTVAGVTIQLVTRSWTAAYTVWCDGKTGQYLCDI